MRFQHKQPGHIEQQKQAVQSMAKSLAPEFATSDTGSFQIKPRQFSRILNSRLLVEQTITNRARQGSTTLGGWLFGSGRYKRWRDEETSLADQSSLTARETAIANNVDLLLGEARPGDDPVIALDFGGGLGLSWMRLAMQPQYKTAIEEGRLAMVVTNLGVTPDLSSDADGYSGAARAMNRSNQLEPDNRFKTEYSNEDLDWAQNSQDHVTYLDANALELPHQSVELRDGASVSLGGRVGVIHEQLSLGHSHIPDLAVVSFSNLLNGRGTFYSEAAMFHHMHPLRVTASEVVLDNGKTVRITEEYRRHRDLALGVGSRLLQAQGFSYKVDESLDTGVYTRQPLT